MRIISDNETLMRFVPNSISPVKGESPLFDKIETFIEAAERWVEQNFTGEDLLADLTMLNPKLVDALRQLVTCEALNRSVPSLDLVLTPNGFGVVSTNTVAAASKQRVDRLIGSIRELRDEAIEETLLLLPKENAWTDTEQAHLFGSTLFPNIDIATLYGISSSRWDKYLELQSRVLGIEDVLAEEYFSPELMRALRREFLLGTLTAPRLRLVHAIRSQIVDVVKDRPIIANRMRDLVNFIRYNPEIFPEWHGSATAKLFSPPKFENKKEAKGYWF